MFIEVLAKNSRKLSTKMREANCRKKEEAIPWSQTLVIACWKTIKFIYHFLVIFVFIQLAIRNNKLVEDESKGRCFGNYEHEEC